MRAAAYGGEIASLGSASLGGGTNTAATHPTVKGADWEGLPSR